MHTLSAARIAKLARVSVKEVHSFLQEEGLETYHREASMRYQPTAKAEGLYQIREGIHGTFAAWGETVAKLVVDKLGPPSRKEAEALRKEVAHLKAEIEEFRAVLAHYIDGDPIPFTQRVIYARRLLSGEIKQGKALAPRTSCSLESSPST